MLDTIKAVPMTINPHFSVKSLLLVLLAGLLSSTTACKPERTKEEMLAGLSEQDRQALEQPMHNSPFFMEGINEPQFTSSGGATLLASEPVIGLVVNGQPKAYPLSRLSSMVGHVVNDSRLDANGQPTPFTVTYCDMTDCIRVLEAVDPVQATSLEVSTYGLLEGGLALQWQGKPYKQRDPIEGLRDADYEKITWGEWKAAHPDTLIYTGPSARRRK